VTAPEPAVEQRRVRSDTWLVTLLAIVVALVIGALLMIFSDDQVRTDLGYFFAAPGDFFADAWRVVSTAYEAMFSGAVYNVHNDGSAAGIFGPIASTLYTSAPLICAGLGISLAFRSGLFNIGGEGQIVAGAFTAGLVGFDVPLPAVLHWLVALAAGVLAGGFWGFIVGFLKARTGAHEVITTIMLNYIALYGLRYLLGLHGVVDPTNPQASKVIDGNAQLPAVPVSGLTLDLGIVLALLAAAGVWWLLYRSTIGFRLRAVGQNPAAARTAGMSVGGSTMQAMLLAGALAGLGGAILTLGGATSYQVTPNISSNIGFDAITVALLGRTSPWGTVGAGLLIGGLKAGGRTMQAVTAAQSALAGQSGNGVPIDIVTVIEALIVIFIAAPRLIRALFRLRGRAAGMLTGVTTNLAVTVSTVRRTRVPRHLFVGGLQILFGLLGVVLFGLGSRAGMRTTLVFSRTNDALQLGSATFTARPVVLVLCAIAVVAGMLRITGVLAARWCASLFIFGLVTAFTIWAVAGSPNGLNLTVLLASSLFPFALPLILGSLAGLLGERSGVVNVAIEGQLLMSAFGAAVVATVVGSAWAGLLGGVIVGVLLAAALAVLSIRYLVDQVIVGVVLDVFALGMTNFLFNKLLSQFPNQLNLPAFFPVVKVPLLGDIPVVGPVLFDGSVLLYLTYALVIIVYIGVFHTRWGLRVRAVGEHPRAADTVGISVPRIRYQAVLLAGALAGLGGASLVIGSGLQNVFGANMTNGIGFIALAAMIFGRWTPVGAVSAALLFGFATELQYLLSQTGSPINPNLLLTAPYIATILAVAGLVGRVRPPAADGQPYTVG
jgi:simple sugar transport system permease protein